MDDLSLSQARRVALGAQGFHRPRPDARVDVRHVRRVFSDLKILQLDFVNVLVPSHYLVLFSRLGPYDPRRLDDLAYRRREVTEGWAHEACLVPMEQWLLLAHRRRCYSPRPRSFASFLEDNPGYLEMALEQVRAGDLADYFRMYVADARPRLEELVDAGELAPVSVEGWRETAYLWPAAHRPRWIRAAALLSPFDPVVWNRRRTRRLFGFDFRFEIFIPQEKRIWGAYVLPFLFGERLVARVDVKAMRGDAGHLRVGGAWLEDHADPDQVAPALASELVTLAGWLGLGGLEVADRGDLAPHLAAALDCGNPLAQGGGAADPHPRRRSPGET